jgi:putative peptidoglycan lipid II flippase
MPSLRNAVTKGLRLSFFIGLPSGVYLAVLSSLIVGVLFQGRSSRFTPDDTVRTAFTASLYSLGLWAYCSMHILVRAFHSLQDAKTPLRISMRMVAVNLILNLILIWPLGVGGLALSTALCASVQVIWLIIKMAGKVGKLDWRQILRSWAKTLLAGAVTGIAADWGNSALQGLLGQGYFMSIVRLGGVTIICAATFLLLCVVLRMSELKELLTGKSSISAR